MCKHPGLCSNIESRQPYGLTAFYLTAEELNQVTAIQTWLR